MSIQVGERIPEVTLKRIREGVETVDTTSLFDGRKAVLFAVPGAFTPTCHRNHLPGYLEKAAEIKAKGVDAIMVTGVNDVFVMDAWSKATGGAGVIEFLSDGNADFAKEIGLSLDGSGFGLGTRSQRYSMLVEDGVVKVLSVEEAAGKAEASGAEAMLGKL